MISYNGKLIGYESMSLEVSNRGFQYGDGIFETIISQEGEVKYCDQHWERIEESIQTLKMEIPFSKSEFLELLLELLKANDLLHHSARMKLYIWRKSGGLYAPTKQKTEFLFTAERAQNRKNQIFKEVRVAQTVHLYKSAFSHIKTISALPYVMAGIEKKERGLEELILLNDEGYIGEASASNIYFLDGSKRTIYTPSLNSGCINGVSRRYLKKEVSKFDWQLSEVMWKIEDLSSSFSAFTVNVAGVNIIQNIEGLKLGDNKEDLEMLQRILPH